MTDTLPSRALSSPSSRQPPGGDSLVVEIGDRALGLDELAFLNRMTTTGFVLPNVAHELNNAFQVIGGLVEMLSARTDLPGDVLDKVGRIGAQAGKSAAMVRDLVAFSRRDHVGVGLVDVAKVVDQALALRRYHLSRARVVVTTAIAPNGPFIVSADGHHLLQVLINLIINAEQALEGCTAPTLTIGVARAAHGPVQVTIDDNAGPIADEVAARACDAFYTTRATKAIGLGLSVGKALVARDGGTLDVAPRDAQGTRATLTLP